MKDFQVIPVTQLIKQISNALAQKYKNETLCVQYAWWVLEAITAQKKTDLIIQRNIALSESQQDQLIDWIEKQVKDNIPLAYLIGSVPFGDCTILVEPPVLIPRMETESWCYELIEKLSKLDNQKFTILDLCTGSGCIAIALAKAFPEADIYATDITDHALALAQKNAKFNDVSNITFISSDLFSEIPENLKFDMIISNPPYVTAQEWQEVDPSVRDWEDHIAHVASQEGTAILKQVIQTAGNYIKPNSTLSAHHIPQLVVEIGHKQAERVDSFFRDAGFCDIVIEKDLQGHDRLVSGCISNEFFQSK